MPYIVDGLELAEIPGYPGYAVTQCGKPYSLHRKKWLGVSTGQTGYLHFSPMVGRKRTSLRLSRAVALAWIPNPENLPEVNHIDGNKANNKRGNLEWISSHGNSIHAVVNRLRRKYTSKFYGVTFDSGPGQKKWMARVWVGGKTIKIGRYLSEEEAAKQYDAYILQHNLPNPINFPQEV